MGVNFPRESFPGANFPKINRCVYLFLKSLLSFYMMFFSQFPDVFSITTRLTIVRLEFLTIYNYIYWEMKN